ncbi:MAG: TetR family transcriptional regulator [Streptosporangiales bacterium]|nr:TetR family transcriptional regulator [Streptosporangiales bacterium]
MSRLSRAQQQERNRAEVLAAARREFTERGFRDTKVDGIAERAGLTRGAVYSNFPSKRALYFAVLADDAERVPDEPRTEPGLTPREALGAFARAWVTRLPLSTDDHSSARLAMDLMPEVLAHDRTRRPFAQLMRLQAILLGLSLERLRGPARAGGRLVRIAETALTTLSGATQLAATAPGFLEPFNVIRACEHLADLDLDDTWPPPHTPHIRTPTLTADEPWSPPAALDAVRGEPARLDGDGVVAVLGLHRLAAAEEAERAAPPDVDVTAVLVTGDPGELAPLTRLALADFRHCLHQAFPASAWPRLQVVCDDSAAVAAAAGLPAVSDVTESAVHVDGRRRLVARADGVGACHSAASTLGRVQGDVTTP